MPIHLITGLPGHGKTLRMMELLDEAANRADRPLFQSGVDGMQPGYAGELADPRQWNAIDPDGQPTCNCPAREGPHAHVIPDGSIIFVDEVWRHFGHLHDAQRAPTPKHVLDLAIHRHRGLDFVMTTQAPNQIFPHMRGLVGQHTHMVRIFGTKWSTMYEWGELVEDVKSAGKRAVAVTTRWRQPSKQMAMYKSASLHTIQSKIPKRFWLLPIGAAFVAAMWYFGLHGLTHQPGVAPGKRIAVTDQAEGGVAAPANTGKTGKPRPATVQEWGKFLTPVLPGIPFTAPAFADRPIVAVPRTVCAIYGDDFRDPGATVCRCITEQGTTPPGISNSLCRSLAINGYYDPTLAPPVALASAAFQAGGVLPAPTGPQVFTLGENRTRDLGQPYRPPEAAGGGGGNPRR